MKVIHSIIIAVCMVSCIATQNSNMNKYDKVYAKIDQQAEVLALASLDPQAD